MTRDLPGIAYERLCATAIPRLRGRLSLLLFGLLYGNFSCGPGARCWGPVRVMMGRGSRIAIGARFWAVSDPRRAGIALFTSTKLRAMPGAEIVIGDGVGLNGTSITARRRIEIGDRTLIAANVVIVDSDFHAHWPADARADTPGAEHDSPVRIGSNVWIGMGSLVLKGVTIGENSIVGAGSVVTRSIPENVVAGGVPAEVIRPLRADEELVRRPTEALG